MVCTVSPSFIPVDTPVTATLTTTFLFAVQVNVLKSILPDVRRTHNFLTDINPSSLLLYAMKMKAISTQTVMVWMDVRTAGEAHILAMVRISTFNRTRGLISSATCYLLFAYQSLVFTFITDLSSVQEAENNRTLSANSPSQTSLRSSQTRSTRRLDALFRSWQ